MNSSLGHAWFPLLADFSFSHYQTFSLDSRRATSINRQPVYRKHPHKWSLTYVGSVVFLPRPIRWSSTISASGLSSTPSSQTNNSKPMPLASVESLLHDKSSVEKVNAPKHESPMAQVRSYVEKQMDQLQQDLEFGFSRAPKISSSPSTPFLSTAARVLLKGCPEMCVTLPICSQDPRPVPIPIDVIDTPVSSPPLPTAQQEFLRSSLKKSKSTHHELDRVPSNRTYGLKINPNEQVIHYLEPYTPQRPLSNFIKRSIPDLSAMINTRPPTIHTFERTVNELKINVSSPSSQPQLITQQQKKVTIQLGDNAPIQRSTR